MIPEEVLKLARMYDEFAGDIDSLIDSLGQNRPPVHGFPPAALLAYKALERAIGHFVTDFGKGAKKCHSFADKICDAAILLAQTDNTATRDLAKVQTDNEPTETQVVSNSTSAVASQEETGNTEQTPPEGATDAEESSAVAEAKAETEAWRLRAETAEAEKNLLTSRDNSFALLEGLEIPTLTGNVIRQEALALNEDVQKGHDRGLSDANQSLGGLIADEYKTLKRNVLAYGDQVEEALKIDRGTTDPAQIAALNTLANTTHDEIVEATRVLSEQVDYGKRTFDAHPEAFVVAQEQSQTDFS